MKSLTQAHPLAKGERQRGKDLGDSRSMMLRYETDSNWRFGPVSSIHAPDPGGTLSLGLNIDHGSEDALSKTTRSKDTGLPEPLKSGVEALSGVSLDGVKVHYNSSQPAQLNASGYAQGRDIQRASGQEPHLPHETFHMVQQSQGRVRPTMQVKEGAPVSDDAGLEKQADIMGARALKIARPRS